MKLTSEIHRPDAEKRKNKRRFDVSHVICEEISTANSQPRSQAHDKRKYFGHVNKPSTAASASHRHYVGFPNYVLTYLLTYNMTTKCFRFVYEAETTKTFLTCRPFPFPVIQVGCAVFVSSPRGLKNNSLVKTVDINNRMYFVR